MYRRGPGAKWQRKGNRESNIYPLGEILDLGALRVDYWVGGLPLCAKLGCEILIDRLAMADGDEANDPRLAVDRVDDSKAADAIFPQAVEFSHERFPAFRVGRNATHSSLDGPFQVWMERADRLSHMRRDIGTEGIHAVRCFLAGVNGSANTSSKESPFFPAL